MNEEAMKHLEEIKDEVLNIQQHIHQHPELSNQEEETSKLVQRKLEEFGIYYESGFFENGVLAVIKGSKEGKTVALRADMDALPIQENSMHECKSDYPGIMHACGHDAHVAMLLGAGYVLHNMREQIEGTILLIFQPAEENSPVGGAEPMMKDGLFKHYQPDVIYGQHVWPDLEVGEIGIRETKMMGASDRFKVIVKGDGGHASMPHQSKDAIVVTGHIITSLQTIVSRSLDPLEASVITIGKINGGYSHNVICDHVEIEGSIRTFSKSIKENLKERFFTIIENTAAAFDVEVDIDYVDGYPPTVNTPKWADLAKKTAKKVVGEDSTPVVNPSLAGEDFSRYLQKYPGAFVWLGTKNKDKGIHAPLHDPSFQIDAKILEYGNAFLVQVALDSLEELKQ